MKISEVIQSFARLNNFIAVDFQIKRVMRIGICSDIILIVIVIVIVVVIGPALAPVVVVIAPALAPVVIVI